MQLDIFESNKELLCDRVKRLKTDKPRFNGPDYDPGLDKDRLTGQIKRVYECMKDGMWRTLDEIHVATGDPQASISAQLRHLRKPRFGGFSVEKRRRGEPSNGLYEYKLVTSKSEDKK